MTRTIYMEVICNECGYRGEMDGRQWSPKANRCPKCHISTLERGETVRQRGTTLDKTMAAALKSEDKPVAELPKELPEPPEVPVTKRYISSGRLDVENYVKEGKTLEEITKLLEGKLAPLTVKAYYYAIRAPERDQVKHKPESPKTKLGRPRTGGWVKCADCGEEIYIRLYRLEGKPKDYPFRCEQCSKPGRKVKTPKPGKTVKLERHKILLINREALLKYLKDLRGDCITAKADSQIVLGINLTIRVLEMMEGGIFILDEENNG